MLLKHFIVLQDCYKDITMNHKYSEPYKVMVYDSHKYSRDDNDNERFLTCTFGSIQIQLKMHCKIYCKVLHFISKTVVFSDLCQNALSQSQIVELRFGPAKCNWDTGRNLNSGNSLRFRKCDHNNSSHYTDKQWPSEMNVRNYVNPLFCINPFNSDAKILFHTFEDGIGYC